jgi:hypothetical protein
MTMIKSLLLVVDIPPKYRSTNTNVIVSMTFGQAEITVEGKVEHSNESVEYPKSLTNLIT